MKIGILTFQRSHNYGALLQAYGLKSHLEGKGHQVEIIDYWPKYHADLYKIFPDFSYLSYKYKLKTVFEFGISMQKVLKRRSGYHDFAINKLELSPTPKFDKAEQLSALDLDAVICGSDQIWRYFKFAGFKGYNEVYWAAYPNKDIKKIAYAASMGIIDGNFDQEKVQTLLSNFSTISVREENLKAKLEPLTTKAISHVLDPVFLLDKQTWSQLTAKPKFKLPKKYVLLYELNASKESEVFAEKLSKKLGAEIRIIKGRVDAYSTGDKYIQTASPEEFIYLIANAEAVVSTSFHGVVFSLVFEKDFYAMSMHNNKERVCSLLRTLGIEERYIENPENGESCEPILYKKATQKLKAQIQLSQNFLLNSLNDKYKEEVQDKIAANE